MNDIVTGFYRGAVIGMQEILGCALNNIEGIFNGIFKREDYGLYCSNKKYLSI